MTFKHVKRCIARRHSCPAHGSFANLVASPALVATDTYVVCDSLADMSGIESHIYRLLPVDTQSKHMRWL